MYTLAMTINHYYWERDRKCHRARQAEKETLESYSQKQGKASTSGSVTAFQSKANLSPVASSTKNPFSKPSPSPTPKKQSNTPRVDLSSKLASNSKLTSNEHKKHLENNLCLYCGAEDHKLDSCPKKQTTVSPKSRGASATADTLAAASKKPLEKQRVAPRTPHRLRVALNSPVQQQVRFNSTHPLFLILTHFLFPLLLP